MSMCYDMYTKFFNCKWGPYKKKGRKNCWKIDAASAAAVAGQGFMIKEEAAKYLRENLLRIREKIEKM